MWTTDKQYPMGQKGCTKRDWSAGGIGVIYAYSLAVSFNYQEEYKRKQNHQTDKIVAFYKPSVGRCRPWHRSLVA